MLKLIASLSMLIDHIGVAFLDSSTSLYLIARCIGRLAMPIFAYKIACGYLYTKNIKKYLYRLLLMTLAAQLPFVFLLYGEYLFHYDFQVQGLSIFFSYWNIGVTFILALLVLFIANRKEIHPLVAFISLFILFMLSNYADYGVYAIAMVCIFYYYEKKSFRFTTCVILIAGIALANTLMTPDDYMLSTGVFHLFSFLSLPLIRHVEDTRVPLPRYFFYYFYPLHMLALVLINYFVL